MRGISKEKIIGMIRAASAAGQQLEQRAEQSGQSGIISKIKKAEEKYERIEENETEEKKENIEEEKEKWTEGKKGKEQGEGPKKNLEEIADGLMAGGKPGEAIANYEMAASEKPSYEILKKLAFAYISSGYPDIAAERLGSYQAKDRWQERSIKILRAHAMLLSADEKIRKEGLLLCSSLQDKSYLDLDALLEEGLSMARQSDYGRARAVSEEISSWINSKRAVLYTRELDSAEGLSNYFLKEADYPETEKLCSAIISIAESGSLLEIRARAIEKSGFKGEIEAAARELKKRFPENAFARAMAEKYGLDANGRH